MSGSRLVRNSPDLARLVDKGYALRIINGHLVVDDVPFVAAEGTVQWGHLLCPLDLTGDRTAKPSSHVMWFAGGEPRDRNGDPIDGLINEGVGSQTVSADLMSSCGFSQKPGPDGYPDYYDKVVSYAAIVAGPARALDSQVTPLTFKPVATDEDDGVFVYLDTFSSRAGISARNQRLAVAKVVIVGLGGTGAYLLDLLAKTPIIAIHLYDDDIFGTHNAFRAAGAASLEQLRAGMKKVDYYAQVYASIRRGLHPHSVRVASHNVGELLDADFVFLTMDPSPDKKVIVDALTAAGVPFVDSGVGVSDDPGGIAGQIRTTTSTPGRSDHITRDGLISYFTGDDADYDTNLQVAELNAFAAVQAVIRFKKTLGFYADAEDERHSVYVIDTNESHNRYGNTDPTRDIRSARPAEENPKEAA